MKIFQVSYDGSWLGGAAIVLAESEYEAIKLVANDNATINPAGMQAKLLTEDLTKGKVLYNDNGEY